MEQIKNDNQLSINSIETYLFKNNTIPMAITNTKLVVVAANEATNKMFGLRNGSIVGKTLYDLNANGTFAFDIEKLKKLLKGEIDSYLINREYLSDNSEIIEGNLLVSLIEIENEKYFSGVFINKSSYNFDLGDSNSKNYEMISTILSTSPDIQYIMDVPRKQYLYKNIDLLHFLGYDNDDVKDQKRWEFLKSKMIEDSVVVFSDGKRYLSEIKKIGEFTDIEYNIVCKDGSLKWLRERSTPLVFGLNNSIQYCYTIIQDVTDKRKVYEKVLDQQRLIEKVATITPDIIFVYDVNTLKNIYNNFNGRKFLGFNEEEWSKIALTSLNNEQKEIFNNHITKIKKASEDVIVEDEMYFKVLDGSVRWVLSKSKVFRYDENGFPIEALTLISDITDYKSAVQSAELSEKTQRAILEATPDLILKISPQGKYLEVIPSKLNDGYSVDKIDIIGKTIFDVLSENEASIVKSELDIAFQLNEMRRFEFERHFEGKKFYLENHISIINNEEAIIVVRNITNKVLMQQTVEDKVMELSTKNSELEKYIAKNRELERFAYIVSHDLKEPLRTINAFSEVIKNKFLNEMNEDAKTYFDFITSSTHRMTALIDGILEYSKIEVNEETFSTEDTNNLLNKVLKDLSANILDSGAIIEFEDLCEIYADPLQIRQLFQNLIANALKFKKNGVNPIIKIKSVEREKDVLFSVSDNGIGISENYFNSIFDMFKRLHARDSYNGQGIGLALCKRIIERHGGNIWVESDGENGSTFYFTILKLKSIN